MNSTNIKDVVNQMAQIKNQIKGTQNTNNGIGNSFSTLLNKTIGEVNNDALNAEKAVENYVTGKSDNLHQTLITLEKSDVSFKMMMEVRKKLLTAYQEIMRLQI